MKRGLRIPSVVWLGLSLVAGVALAAGCSAGADDIDSSTSAVHAPPLDEAKELDSILGDDRVARYLRANSTAIPNHFDKVETAFGIGRKCNRADSKEIWVAEEKDTRISGAQVELPQLMPRLAIGGCQQTLGNFRESFELMVAMVSDPTRPVDDAIPNQPVEFMAFDNSTGLFNFYVLEPGATEEANATVSRFVRLGDDTVQKWTKEAGKAATREDFPQRKCFNCHVHGGPVMNELTEPWTNWVSQHKTLSRPMSGGTHELVSESRPFPGEPGVGRSTIAQDLERVTRASIAMWVEGIPGVAGSGFGPQTLSGKQPGGVSTLLRSVLCGSEVNFASVLTPDEVPTSLFVDQSIALLASLAPPVPPLGVDWTLLPVRSETDKRVEIFLQKQRILMPDTVMAARVFDDTHEVYSDKRCALHADATARLAPGVTPDAAVRASILASLDKDDAARAAGQPSTTTAAQRAYTRALVGANVAGDVRDAAETAYIADITARVAADAAKLDDADGRTVLFKRWTDRQGSARAQFDRPENMLPLTYAPVVVTASSK